MLARGGAGGSWGQAGGRGRARARASKRESCPRTLICPNAAIRVCMSLSWSSCTSFSACRGGREGPTCDTHKCEEVGTQERFALRLVIVCWPGGRAESELDGECHRPSQIAGQLRRPTCRQDWGRGGQLSSQRKERKLQNKGTQTGIYQEQGITVFAAHTAGSGEWHACTKLGALSLATAWIECKPVPPCTAGRARTRESPLILPCVG